MNSTIRPCPLCRSVNAALLTSMRAEQIINSSAYYDDNAYETLSVSKSDSFGIAQCEGCDFVYTASVPSNDFLASLYESQDIEKSIAVFARPERAAYAFKSLSTLLSAISDRCKTDPKGQALTTPHILDVGCAYGVGSLGLTMKHYPYKISGVEWSANTREYLSSEGMTTYQDINDIPDTLSFDGILLNDVLEHVPEPIAFLEKVREISHDNTTIWINVPNFIDWRLNSIVEQASKGSMCVAKDFNPWEHLSYFSPISLDTALAKIGAKRLINDTVDYSICCNSMSEYLKSLIKFIRDLNRIYKKNYLNTTSTAALYTFR